MKIATLVGAVAVTAASALFIPGTAEAHDRCHRRSALVVVEEPAYYRDGYRDAYYRDRYYRPQSYHSRYYAPTPRVVVHYHGRARCTRSHAGLFIRF